MHSNISSYVCPKFLTTILVTYNGNSINIYVLNDYYHLCIICVDNIHMYIYFL